VRLEPPDLSGQTTAGSFNPTFNNAVAWQIMALRVERVIVARAYENAALTAALTQPIWLEPHETFAIAGGIGFSQDRPAFGATAVIRLDQNVSAYAGAALSTGGLWAGKVGARIGW